jgi:hypothetical protein
MAQPEYKSLLHDLKERLKEKERIKVTEDELMLYCMEFCLRYFGQFVREEFPAPAITPEKLNMIIGLIKNNEKVEIKNTPPK